MVVTFQNDTYFFPLLMVSLPDINEINEKSFLKIIFPFTTVAVLLYLKVLDAVLYIVSFSLCERLFDIR